MEENHETQGTGEKQGALEREEGKEDFIQQLDSPLTIIDPTKAEARTVTCTTSNKRLHVSEILDSDK